MYKDCLLKFQLTEISERQNLHLRSRIEFIVAGNGPFFIYETTIKTSLTCFDDVVYKEFYDRTSNSLRFLSVLINDSLYVRIACYY